MITFREGFILSLFAIRNNFTFFKDRWASFNLVVVFNLIIFLLFGLGIIVVDEVSFLDKISNINYIFGIVALFLMSLLYVSVSQIIATKLFYIDVDKFWFASVVKTGVIILLSLIVSVGFFVPNLGILVLGFCIIYGAITNVMVELKIYNINFLSWLYFLVLRLLLLVLLLVPCYYISFIL